MVTPRHDVVYADLAKLATGLKEHAHGQKLSILETVYTVPQVVRRITALIAAGAAVERQRGLLNKAIATERALRESEAAFLNALRGLLRATYLDATLADLGVAKKKARRVATVDEKATRNERVKATRAARHTMGKRQRAKVKGVVVPE